MSINTNIKGQFERLKQDGKKASRGASTSRLMETLMRLGYMVRGLVYGVIGVLAIQVALGVGGAITDVQGAIVATSKTPIGGILLYGVLIGLIGYALWGLIRAVFDPLHKGTDFKGVATRVGYAVSGISYALLAVATYGLITGAASAARGGTQGAQTQQAAASILAYSWGPWAVGIVALVVIGIGLIQVFQGVGRNFDQQFQPYTLSSAQRIWIIRVGRFGTAARGIVFTLIGLFLFLAAYHNDPNQVKGIDGVLTTLLHQPFGPWLLGVVALGLIAFGVYSALSGVWLRFKRTG